MRRKKNSDMQNNILGGKNFLESPELNLSEMTQLSEDNSKIQEVASVIGMRIK